jgi:hypothetical protein
MITFINEFRDEVKIQVDEITITRTEDPKLRYSGVCVYIDRPTLYIRISITKANALVIYKCLTPILFKQSAKDTKIELSEKREKMITFMNEFQHEIKTQVDEITMTSTKDPKLHCSGVHIYIGGPAMHADISITKEEALVIYEYLTQILFKQSVKDAKIEFSEKKEKMTTFTDEFQDEIKMQVDEITITSAEDPKLRCSGIRIYIDDPTSYTDISITKEKALVLYKYLTQILFKQSVKDAKIEL